MLVGGAMDGEIITVSGSSVVIPCFINGYLFHYTYAGSDDKMHLVERQYTNVKAKPR